MKAYFLEEIRTYQRINITYPEFDQNRAYPSELFLDTKEEEEIFYKYVKTFSRKDLIEKNENFRKVDDYLKDLIGQDCWGVYLRKEDERNLAVFNHYESADSEFRKNLYVDLKMLVGDRFDQYDQKGKFHSEDARDLLIEDKKFLHDILLNMSFNERLVICFFQSEGFSVVVSRNRDNSFQTDVYYNISS